MICRRKAQKTFGARYSIATLQLVVYVCCSYFAILPNSSDGSQRRGTATSAGKHLCCGACVMLGVAQKPHQISAMYFWELWTSTNHCNIMADMLMHTSTSTSYPAAHLHFLGLHCHSNLPDGLQVTEATALCRPNLHRECCSVCQPDVLHHAKCISEPEALQHHRPLPILVCLGALDLLEYSRSLDFLKLLLKHDSFNMQWNVTVTTEDMSALVKQCSVAGQSDMS